MKKVVCLILVCFFGFNGVFGLWLFWEESSKSESSTEIKTSEVKAKKQAIALSTEEKELLARTVYGEARGESFEGQVAVASVIINRLEDARFPNEVQQIVYQPLAFTAVADGQIGLGYDKEAYTAVEKALEGYDPSGGALYYYNPDKSTSSWIWSRKVIKRIGNHVFAI